MFQTSSMRSCLFILLLFNAGISLSQTPPKGFIHTVYMKDTIFKKMDLTQHDTKAYFARVLQTASACSIACSPLPVKWLSIKGERSNDSTCIITWETSNEANNKGFDVERSLGNTTRFIKVGFVPAATSSDPALHYSVNDANDFMGTSFYRLRQVDLDNKFEYSKVVPVKGYTKEEALEVHPNPARNQIQLSLLLIKNGRTHLQLFDADGRMIKQQDQSFSKGLNLLSWNISSLSAGTYFILANTPADKVLSLKFIKN